MAHGCGAFPWGGAQGVGYIQEVKQVYTRYYIRGNNSLPDVAFVEFVVRHHVACAGAGVPAAFVKGQEVYVGKGHKIRYVHKGVNRIVRFYITGGAYKAYVTAEFKEGVLNRRDGSVYCTNKPGRGERGSD